MVYIVIADANDLPGLRAQERLAARIVPSLRVTEMGGAIDFHNQASADAGEVRDVGSDWLPPQSHSTDPMPKA
ncbi:MAG TPA: hypothetical protein VGI20_15540 [Rhizomicrobium sp.]|jgi:hypothetical protein